MPGIIQDLICILTMLYICLTLSSHIHTHTFIHTITHIHKHTQTYIYRKCIILSFDSVNPNLILNWGEKNFYIKTYFLASLLILCSFIEQISLLVNLGMLELSYRFQTITDYSFCRQQIDSIINTRTSVCPF